MPEPLPGRELMAIRARVMRARDKSRLTRAEKDRDLLLVEVYRLWPVGEPDPREQITSCDCGYVGHGPCPRCTPDPSDREAVA